MPNSDLIKRRRCAISNRWCTTLDGRCPAGRFGRTNNRPRRCRPIPSVRSAATSTGHRNLPEKMFLSKLKISFVWFVLIIGVVNTCSQIRQYGRNLCLRFDIQRTSSRRRWWRWCLWRRASPRTVGCRWWAHLPPAGSWVERGNLMPANF